MNMSNKWVKVSLVAVAVVAAVVIVKKFLKPQDEGDIDMTPKSVRDRRNNRYN